MLVPEEITDLPSSGEEAASLFVVAAGWCTATRSLPDGRQVIVGIRGVGQIAGVERIASCVRLVPPSAAASRRCRFLAELPGWTAAGWVSAVPVPVEELRAAMQQLPAVRDDADALAHERIVELETALAERGLETADRLYRALRRMALRYGTATALGHALDLPLGQAELALLVGTTRETVNRALRRLSAQGIVTLWEGRPLLIRTDVAGWRRTR
ncbi:MAG: Crp/Fnr family transcriptional regulator [Actinomycetota bacterium]